jgi:hypothetical protein
MREILYLLFWAGVVLAVGLIFYGLILIQLRFFPNHAIEAEKQRLRELEEAERGPREPRRQRAPRERQSREDRAPARADIADEPSLIAPIQDEPIEERRHTIGAAPTGGGKSTTMYTLAISDAARGVQCVICSPQFSAYHEKEQPIDLRPAMHHFEVGVTAEQIEDLVGAVHSLIEPRLERYRLNAAIGHPIALYLGEWERTQRICDERIVDQVIDIIDQGRILNLWIGFMEVHAGLVSRLGGDSGFRQAFRTRLAGNDVDPTTWRTFVGRRIEPQPIPFGYWMTADGLTQVIPPDRGMIMRLANSRSRWPPLMRPEPAARRQPDFSAGELEDVLNVRASEHGSQLRTSLERGEPVDQTVHDPPVSRAELAYISRELGRGTPPSKIAKSMPGYQGKLYQAYMAKVEWVKDQFFEEVQPTTNA